MKEFHLHLISDSTGETVDLVARACLVQFDNVKPIRHIGNMVRSPERMDEMIRSIENAPGLVFYTMVDTALQQQLEEGCRRLGVVCVPILEPVVQALGQFLGMQYQAQPGRQHTMDAEYFNRIEALNYVLGHDDGQSVRDLEQADVVVIGVSRTSKTPTSIYLANRGIKTANVPIVPGCLPPDELFTLTKPLKVGLTKDPMKLVSVRQSRLEVGNQTDETDYVDIETVSEEVEEAQALFEEHGWPVIDVTNKSVEEVAATILDLYKRRLEQQD